ncbi:hypothetical protein D910_12592 [Dendroctonus ponderosae]|uniref:Uncharacterized protein n=1 Tax=Dendroctonus ponderosae TaxID=77166 RepID=U4UY80_DENPD|nr:hypothetical protein D910_12592 [Dendroctonus ponderosae]
MVHAELPFERNLRIARQHQLSEIYGPPSVQPSPGEEDSTTEVPLTTTDKDSESIDAERARKLNEKLTENEAGDVGIYYIYHPSGLLQKVSYLTKDDVKQMLFSAKLKYENVEPVAGPVYTYDPTTFVFKKIQ